LLRRYQPVISMLNMEGLWTFGNCSMAAFSASLQVPQGVSDV
jgi:hypothetical protein